MKVVRGEPHKCERVAVRFVSGFRLISTLCFQQSSICHRTVYRSPLALQKVSKFQTPSLVQASDDAELGDDYDNPDNVRHAETPELAREALVDSVVLIYKSQVEVAFREQTAGHNALLLFVHLALGMMEEQVLNEYKELEARRAEVRHKVQYVILSVSQGWTRIFSGLSVARMQAGWMLQSGSRDSSKTLSLAVCGLTRGLYRGV